MKIYLLVMTLFVAIPVNLNGQDSTATVHFYRTGSIYGALIDYTIYHDSAVVGLMKPSSVFTCRVNPGINKFTARTESKEFIFINAKAAEEYFVKCSLATGLIVGRPRFEIVKPEAGKAAIVKIKSKTKVN